MSRIRNTSLTKVRANRRAGCFMRIHFWLILLGLCPLIVSVLTDGTGTGGPADPQQRNTRALGELIDSSPPDSFPPRLLQASPCSLCGNYTLLPDVIPDYELEDENGEPIPQGRSCRQIASDALGLASQSSECWQLKSNFLHGCCDAPPLHECETKLRSELLDGYDPAVMPANTTKPGARLDVDFQLDFFHITSIQTAESTANIFVWIWMSWKDQRLAWDVNEHCAFQTTFYASVDKEVTEIWVPDVDLYNQERGIQQMPEASAEVRSDGTVVWRRNGGLKALCLFSGLRRMPFDTLGCRYSIGAWTRADQINLRMANGTGFYVGGFLAKYAEYRLIRDMVKTGYFYDRTPMRGIYYEFYFQRATWFYVVGLMLPSIVFTILSFGMFLLDLRVGERLSYGMSLLLVLATQRILASSYLPVTGEFLFLVLLINASFYWVVIALMESVCVAYLYFAGLEDVSYRDIRPGSVSQGNSALRQSHRTSNNDLDSILEEDTEDNMETQANQGDNESRRGLSIGKSFSFVFTLQQAMMARSHDRNRNQKLIHSMDKWCFRIMPLTYFLFLIVMFATLPLWEESGEDVWGTMNEL